MDCKDFMPLFLLYNKNNLNGFGWTTNGYVASSTGRIERAPMLYVNVSMHKSVLKVNCGLAVKASFS